MPGGGRYSFGMGAFFSASFCAFGSEGLSDCDSPDVGKRSRNAAKSSEMNCIGRAYTTHS